MAAHDDTLTRPPPAVATPSAAGVARSWEPSRLASATRAAVVHVRTPGGEAVRPFANPLRAAAHLWRLRRLTWQLAERELAARFRGSFLGILWSFLLPLMMLAVYTFVFAIVFQTRWVGQDGQRPIVALILFAGIVPFNLLSEVLATAPQAITANPGYVKRIVFPLEVLPLVRFLVALVNALASMVVLVFGLLAMRGNLPATLPLFPVVWLPLLLYAVAAAYGLAAFGVFVRDVTHAVGALLPFLFFLTPIVYPAEAVPEGFRFVAHLNPIAHVVDDSRRVLVFGMQPGWPVLAANATLAAALAFVTFLAFMKSKRAFHDGL